MGIFSLFWFAIIGCLFFSGVYAPPPNRKESEAQRNESPSKEYGHQQQQQQQEEQQEALYKFAYSEYLEQVVKILEAQPSFQERIRSMNEEQIKTGQIAEHIDDLPQEMFDHLTKVKLKEVERIAKASGDPLMAEHLVGHILHFTKEDLRKLILTTVADMRKKDEERREKFKEYEMQKKAEWDHDLAQMPEEERKIARQKLVEKQKRLSEHEKLNHPGGREQLEEVWEERDQMNREDYNPRTFFALHDLNSDGYWNNEEIEALFQLELQKIYNDSNPESDPRKKVEEMYEMREHVVNQMDKNSDGLISLQEFLNDQEAQNPDQKDPGWEDLTERQNFTDEELKRFEEEYAKKQGWGDHPYDFNETPHHQDGQFSPEQQRQPHEEAQRHYQQPQGQNNPPPPVEVHPVQSDANAQNLNNNAGHQQQMPPQAQKIEKPVDPVYGI